MLYTHAGPEIGVAATKTFTAQVAAVSLVGLALAQARGTKYGDEISREYAALAGMPELMAQTLGVVEPVRELAREIAQAKAVLFLGRGVGYPVALEGALKLKELAYMHAEGFPAGELKHGPIALDRGRAAGRHRHALTDRSAVSCTGRCCPTSPRSAPVARARSSSPSGVTRLLARMRPI